MKLFLRALKPDWTTEARLVYCVGPKERPKQVLFIFPRCISSRCFRAAICGEIKVFDISKVANSCRRKLLPVCSGSGIARSDHIVLLQRQMTAAVTGNSNAGNTDSQTVSCRLTGHHGSAVAAAAPASSESCVCVCVCVSVSVGQGGANRLIL